MSKECRELFSAINHPKKRAFLLSYIELGLVTKAAEVVGMNRVSHLVWLKNDPDYVAAFALAKELAADRLEDEATRRALGWKEIRYDADGQPYEVPKHSDTLLIFRLKGEFAKYREAPAVYGYAPDVVEALVKKVVALVGPDVGQELAADLRKSDPVQPR